MTRRNTDADFMSLVSPEPNSGCWLWTGTTNDEGYGVFVTSGRKLKAHRRSYEIHVGPTLGLCVLHACDNRSCVNPGHLHLGTRTDNANEAASRNRLSGPLTEAYRSGRRSARGVRNPRAKMTEEQVRSIRPRRESGESVREIASSLRVSKGTVQAVLNGLKWRHLGASS